VVLSLALIGARAAARLRLRSAAPRCARFALAGLAFTLFVGSGCATLRERLAFELTGRSLELSFDRPSDLLPPEGMRVTSTDGRAVSLAWDPVLLGDVAGYAITRSNKAEGPYDVVGLTYSRFATVYVDRGREKQTLGDGQTYFYRVHPYDGGGHASRSHAFARATTEPAPEKPDSPQAYSSLPRRVVLSWTASERRSVAGYAVLRSPTQAGPWEEVAFVEGRVTTIYEDEVPGDLRVMYYRLQAVNGFGGKSEMSEPVRAVTKAKPLPPLVPKVAQSQLGAIALEWPRNVEPDLVRYELWRAPWSEEQARFGEEERVISVDVPATAATDDDVGCGQRIRYRLRAVDDDGLVSDPSEALEVVARDIGLQARASNGRAELRWDAERARGFPTARIVQRRAFWPDRVLGEVRGTTAFPLPPLGSGEQRLEVQLVRPPDAAPDAGAPAAPRAPACAIVVRTP
jgi:fibronectin type 3 domain-containing protein